jgi:hypothetical protein
MSIFKRQKNRWRLYLSFLIVLIAVTFSGFLIFAPPPDTQKSKNALVSAESGSDMAQINPSLDFTARSLDNLTGQFTDQALKELIAKNQGIAKTKDPSKARVIPDPKDVDQIISKIIDDQSKEVVIGDKDIQINDDNSKDIQKLYLVFIDGVMRDSLSPLTLQNLDNTSLSQYFASTANQLKKVADILTVVKVPPAWISIHKQLIAYFTVQENVFQSLAAAENDPLRFMIASNQVLSNEISSGFDIIKSQINKKIKDEGLI